jgi:beta-glucanase (GH16 family)
MKKTVLFLLLSTFVVCRLYSQSYQLIGVSSPAYCSEIEGNTTIEILAPGCPEVTISCWKQGDGFGANSVIGTVTLDENGTGSIVFPADEYPHGPITIKISGEVVIIPPDIAILSDECDLQLYNKGGVSWNEGLPDTPPAAEGMTLVYADDFDGELSVGSDSKRFTYYDHKPPYGNQDFSSIPFTSAMSKEKNPFSQADSYLRIRADVNKNSSGLISSMFSNKSGFSATYPSYFECRFVGPKVPGSWPAFWLLSVPNAPYFGDNNEAVDELDIIEAYGANSTNHQYVCTPHAWNQASELQAICDRFYNTTGFVTMTNFGIPSTWYDTFHTYGLKITETETIYYCDNIEVGRHETLPVSKAKPFFFMINLATQGTDMAKNLARYDGIMDMYVDYVRVYSSAASSGINLPEKSDLDVSVFPNPVNSEAVVSFESPSLENISVNIFNVLGQPVFSKSIYEQGAVNIPVDMLSMNAGIYLMKIRAGGLQTTKTVIKI